MAIVPFSEIRNVTDITQEQRQAINYFMQGAVYCWIKNFPDVPFAVRDLMGGINNNWTGTPLQILYDKYINKGQNHDESIQSAGKDLGWLVKSMLSQDIRTFEVSHPDIVAKYQLITP